MKTSQPISEIVQALCSSERILVISHTSPDPDAYGSSTALARILKQAGKKVVLVNESGIIDKYLFISGISEVISEIPQESFDLICVLDCGELKRVGDSLLEKVRNLHPLLNIDHHISNDLFGDLNYVITDASSTSELIFDIAQQGSFEIPAEAASSLYTGITGDTGSFRYSNTTEKVFATAAALVKLGADPGAISQNLYSQNTPASIQVQATALSSMEFLNNKKVAWIVVPEKLAKQYGATKEDTEGLVEKGRDIQGVLISVFIREEEGIWKVSLRSKDPRYNVSKLASQFGGGGHVMAAAFRWKRPYDELSKNLREALTSTLQS